METLTDYKDIIEFFGIEQYDISIPEIGTVLIEFFNVHWYSLFYKYKIRKLKKYLSDNKHLIIMVKYKLTNKRK